METLCDWERDWYRKRERESDIERERERDIDRERERERERVGEAQSLLWPNIDR